MHSGKTVLLRQDLYIRLFFRFLVCYLLILTIGYVCAAKGLGFLWRDHIARSVPLFVVLALIGGFSSISNIYLLLLTAVKALWEAQIVYRAVLLIQAGSMMLLTANACLLSLYFSLLVFTAAAALACRFAFENRLRDLRLLCSRSGARYLLQSLCLFSLALLSYLLWSHLLSLSPL